MKTNVAVLGASSKPERYSYQAVALLSQNGYGVFPVHPSEKSVNGVRCYPKLSAIDADLDTITVYLSEKNSSPLVEEIIDVHPRRVILNPGAENGRLRKRCEEAGIQVLEACTLVMLRIGKF